MIKKIAAILLLCSFTSSTYAAKFWFQDNARLSQDTLVIEGKIEAGDYEALRDVISNFGPLIKDVYLYSPGGDAIEAMKMGDLLRNLYLTTVSPNFSLTEYQRDRNKISPACDRSYEPGPKDQSNCTCDSACFLIWLGGFERKGVYVGVHRPVFDTEFYSSISPSDAEALYESMIASMEEYLQKYKVPDEIIEQMLNTPSHEIHGIWAEQLGGYPAFYDERLTAICGVTTNTGPIRLLELKREEGRITAEEEDELEMLQSNIANNSKIEQCRFEQFVIKDRFQAFEGYFGAGYIENWQEHMK